MQVTPSQNHYPVLRPGGLPHAEAVTQRVQLPHWTRCTLVKNAHQLPGEGVVANPLWCDPVGCVEVPDRVPVAWAFLLREQAGQVEVHRRGPFTATQCVDVDRNSPGLLVQTNSE